MVLLAGKKSHRAGEHDYDKAMRLFKHCLDTAPNVKGVVTEAHTNGWPENPKTLQDADTIVLFSDGNGRAQHPFMVGDRMAVIEKLMKRGCGLVVIHWSLSMPTELGNETLVRWIGGFDDYQKPPRGKGEPVRVEGWSKQAAHPICRGLKPFEMPKSEYFSNVRVQSDQPGFVPILPFPGKADSPLWAWAWQREDGGRGFGFSGGHGHSDWNTEGLRMAMLNAILWTAKMEVPAEGVISTVAADSEFAGEPVFIPIKIDGPANNPAIGSYWYGPFNESCSLVDVNGDGRLDITCGVNWYEAPKWKKHRYYFEDAEKRDFLHGHCTEVAMDVNRDGLVDVVNSGYQSDIAGVLWHENTGQRGGKWQVHRVHSSPAMEGVLLADMDGDRDLDILMNHFRLYGGLEGERAVGRVEPLAWLESINKSPWLVKRVIAAEADDHGNGVGDINGDRRLDVVTGHGWYEAPPDPRNGKWRFHKDYELLFRPSHPMLVTDVNGDKLNDIIVGNSHGYGLYWLQQKVDAQGKRSFELHTIEQDYGSFHTMTLADINGDGKVDLLTGKRLFGHDGNDESEWDPLFMFWYDIKGGRFERHVISFNNLQYYPGGENSN
ncbi:VCBS repeat-containing protein, partial [Candidatus Sumerlaeota bacterium]|nr:VCBS repeat-containing protein [Candidatus Sumerlaeota bacterium]